MGSIPVRVTKKRTQDFCPVFFFCYPFVNRHSVCSQTHGFATLLRRFRVGSLVGRSKFPYGLQDKSPVFFFCYPFVNRHSVCLQMHGFAYPTRSSESSLSRRRVWVYSPKAKLPRKKQPIMVFFSTIGCFCTYMLLFIPFIVEKSTT